MKHWNIIKFSGFVWLYITCHKFILETEIQSKHVIPYKLLHEMCAIYLINVNQSARWLLALQLDYTVLIKYIWCLHWFLCAVTAKLMTNQRPKHTERHPSKRPPLLFCTYNPRTGSEQVCVDAPPYNTSLHHHCQKNQFSTSIQCWPNYRCYLLACCLLFAVVLTISLFCIYKAKINNCWFICCFQNIISLLRLLFLVR